MAEKTIDTLTLYVIRSQDGKYLRSKGYQGSGECWVTDINKAKMYAKIGPAHAQVTWWANAYPKFGVPDIVPLIATPGDPIDQTDRVKKAQRTKQLKELNEKLWRAEEQMRIAKNNVTYNKVGWKHAQAVEIHEKAIKKYNSIKDELETLKSNK